VAGKYEGLKADLLREAERRGIDTSEMTLKTQIVAALEAYDREREAQAERDMALHLAVQETQVDEVDDNQPAVDVDADLETEPPANFNIDDTHLDSPEADSTIQVDEQVETASPVRHQRITAPYPSAQDFANRAANVGVPQ
jgi:hypothetical protein